MATIIYFRKKYLRFVMNTRRQWSASIYMTVFYVHLLCGDFICTCHSRLNVSTYISQWAWICVCFFFHASRRPLSSYVNKRFCMRRQGKSIHHPHLVAQQFTFILSVFIECVCVDVWMCIFINAIETFAVFFAKSMRVCVKLDFLLSMGRCSWHLTLALIRLCVRAAHEYYCSCIYMQIFIFVVFFFFFSIW